MELYIVFGQRDESYPGQLAPEALHVMDEYSYLENPQWIHDKLEGEKKHGDYVRVELLTFAIPEIEFDILCKIMHGTFKPFTLHRVPKKDKEEEDNG